MTESEIEAGIEAAIHVERDLIIDILEAAEKARSIEFQCQCGRHFTVKSEKYIIGELR
jgi:hypothetical protein